MRENKYSSSSAIKKLLKNIQILSLICKYECNNFFNDFAILFD